MSLVQIYQGVAIFHGAVPDSILETPFRFEVLNQGYNIRSAPNKDDSSFNIGTMTIEKEKVMVIA